MDNDKRILRFRMLALALSLAAVTAGATPPDVILNTDFNSGLPAGSSVVGNAYYDGGNGFVHLTDFTQGSPWNGSWIYNQGAVMRNLYVRCDMLVGGGSGADGFSFVYSNLSGGAFGEDGEGSGLIITFNTYTDAPPLTAPNFQVHYNGATLHTIPINAANIRLDAWVPFEVSITHNGDLTVKYNNTVYANINVAGWNPQPGWRMGYGARVGGANDNHWLDNVQVINAEPYTHSMTTLDSTPVGPPTASVRYKAIFSQPLQGLDTGDFAVTQLSGTAGANVASVSPVFFVNENFDDGDVDWGSLDGNDNRPQPVFTGGHMRLTEASGNENSSWIIPTPEDIDGFRAEFGLYIGSSTEPAADGFSFVYSPDATGLFNHMGLSTGLTVRFDTYENGGEGTPDITVLYNGTERGRLGKVLSDEAWHDVVIAVTREGVCTVTHAGSVVADNLLIPDWDPQSDWNFGVGAATGGSNDIHAVDNFQLWGDRYVATLDSLAGQGDMRLDLSGSDATGFDGTPISPNSQNGGNIYQIDFVAPNPPSVPDMTAASDRGPSSTDNNTNDTTPTFTGTAEAGSTVRIYSDVDGVVGSGVAVGGTYTITTTSTLSQGPHTTTATAADDFQEGAPSSGVFVVINTDPPDTLGITTSTPSPTTLEDILFTVNFDEAVAVTTADFQVNTSDDVSYSSLGISPAGPATSYEVTVQGVTGDSGALSMDVLTGQGAQDVAGNPLASGASSTSVNIDNVPPVLNTLDVSESSPTSADTLAYTLQFDTPVVNFSSDDIDVTSSGLGYDAPVIAPSAGPATDYTITIENIVGNGSIDLSVVQSGDAQDIAGNGLTADTAAPSIEIDNTVPVVFNLDRDGNPATTTSGVVTFRLLVSEDIQGVEPGDFKLEAQDFPNAAVTQVEADNGTGLDDLWTITVNTVDTARGTVRLDIAAGATLSDPAANPVSTPYTGDESYTVDTEPPYAVNIGRGGLPEGANTQQVVFTATFNEDVENVEGGDFTVTAPQFPSPTIVDVSSNDGGVLDSVWLITVDTGAPGEGGVRLDLNDPPTIQDELGNAVQNGRTGDETFFVDTVAPSVDSLSTAAPDPTGTAPIPFTVRFSEDMDPATFTAGDLDVTNGNVSGFTQTGPRQWSFDVEPQNPGFTPYDVTVALPAGVCRDLRGNGNEAATPVVRTFDSSAPTVSVTTTSDPLGYGATNLSPIVVNVSFSEPVLGFDPEAEPGDLFLVNGTLAAASFSGGGDAYSFDVTPSGEGTVVVEVPENAANDGVNGNLSGSLTIEYDVTSPGVVIGSTAGDPASVDPIPVQITFDEVVLGFTQADAEANLTNATVATFTAEADGRHFTLELAPQGAGDVTLSIDAGVATDEAGNDNTASAPFSIEYDPYPVTVSYSGPNPIYAQPGDAVEMEVGYTVGGGGSATFQWLYKAEAGDPWSPIAGAPNAGTYTIGEVEPADEGFYSVVVTGGAKDVTQLAPPIELVVGTGIPAAGAAGLGLLALASALAGAAALRRTQ